MLIDLKEVWSKLKYWQMSGIVAVMVGTVLFYIVGWRIIDLHPQKIGTTLLLIFSFLFSPIAFSNLLINENEFLLVYLVSIVIYFLIGASIAHVIYERKNSIPSSDKSKKYTRIIVYLILLFYFSISVFYYILGLSY